MSSFGNRSTKDLYKFIATSMPAGAPGTLGEEQYTNITAYLLYANGAKAGSAMLSKDTDVKVSSVADGKVIAEAIAPPILGKMAAAEARSPSTQRRKPRLLGCAQRTNPLPFHPARRRASRPR